MSEYELAMDGEQPTRPTLLGWGSGASGDTTVKIAAPDVAFKPVSHAPQTYGPDGCNMQEGTAVRNEYCRAVNSQTDAPG